MFGVVLIVSAVILIIPTILFWLSFRDGHPVDPTATYSWVHYRQMFEDRFLPEVLGNTLGFSLTSLAVAMGFGLPIAWLVVRTDLSGKSIVYTLMTIGLLMPGFATAMGWLFLMHPRIGIVNQYLMDAFRLLDPPFTITSVVGMGWVQGLSLAPVAFIMNAGILRALDPTLEESAAMSGASFWQIICRVTLPLAWPGILAAGIYIFTIGFAAFDVPAIIGWSNRIYTFATFLMVELTPSQELPKYGPVAALSGIVILMGGLLSLLYGSLQKHAHRYQVVTGKAYRPRLLQLGAFSKVAWFIIGSYFALSKLVPLLLIVWASLLQYFQAPSIAALSSVSLAQFQNLPWDLLIEAMKNTALLMLFTPTITLLVAVCFSWVVLRSQIRGRLFFDFIAFLPHAIPNILFGIGVLLFALSITRGALMGTVWILLLVFVIARLSYATRMTNGAYMQIHKDLEEAATMSGASTGRSVMSIIMPLLKPTLVYAWLWMALMTFRELTLAVVLTTRENLTMPVMVWSVMASNGLGGAAAISLLLLIAMTPIVAIYWWLARRQGVLGEMRS